MKTISRPRTNKAEVLYALIKDGTVSIMDFPYMSGFRTRVSEIKIQLPLNRKLITKINGHGNSYNYAIHRLSEFNFTKGINLYHKINK